MFTQQLLDIICSIPVLKKNGQQPEKEYSCGGQQNQKRDEGFLNTYQQLYVKQQVKLFVCLIH